jgi:hypothetical protein
MESHGTSPHYFLIHWNFLFVGAVFNIFINPLFPNKNNTEIPVLWLSNDAAEQQPKLLYLFYTIVEYPWV